jgi:hypothetical protein
MRYRTNSVARLRYEADKLVYTEYMELLERLCSINEKQSNCLASVIDHTIENLNYSVKYGKGTQPLPPGTEVKVCDLSGVWHEAVINDAAATPKGYLYSVAVPGNGIINLHESHVHLMK